MIDSGCRFLLTALILVWACGQPAQAARESWAPNAPVVLPAPGAPQAQTIAPQPAPAMPGGDEGPGALVRRVVLDPGHGGDETGSRGPTGVLEKDVVLELAKAAAQALRRDGYEVHLTRTEDRNVSDEQRAAVANYWRADLFLSLHASGVGRPQARGYEVMVEMKPGPKADARSWAGGQVGRWAESRRWAQVLGASLGEVLPTFDRGIVEIPSPVLEATACPASLVEVGSLAWPSEEELLRSAAGRVGIANAITRAVDAFFRGPPDGAAAQTPKRQP